MTEKRFDYVMNEFDEIEYITDIVDCEDRDFADFLDYVNKMAKENKQLKKAIDEADDLIKSHLSAHYNRKWENICEHLGVDLND